MGKQGRISRTAKFDVCNMEYKIWQQFLYWGKLLESKACPPTTSPIQFLFIFLRQLNWDVNSCHQSKSLHRTAGPWNFATRPVNCSFIYFYFYLFLFFIFSSGFNPRRASVVLQTAVGADNVPEATGTGGSIVQKDDRRCTGSGFGCTTGMLFLLEQLSFRWFLVSNWCVIDYVPEIFFWWSNSVLVNWRV